MLRKSLAVFFLVCMSQAKSNIQSILGYFNQNPDLDEVLMEDEDGTGRLGFVQLNSGSTSFNTTLNLTGPILLGLGIAAATLFYAYFNAFQGSANGYSRYKRFADGLNPVNLEDAILALQSLDQEEEEEGGESSLR